MTAKALSARAMSPDRSDGARRGSDQARERTPGAKTGGSIRRLWSFETVRVRDHLLRLDRNDRLLRFAGYTSAAGIAAYCARLDWDRAVVLGCLAGGEVRGIGELKPIGRGGPRAAELAVSVESPYQDRGIGTALLRRLVIFARNRLLDRLHMIGLIDNGKALRLARRLDGALRFDHGEAEARIEPPWPTPGPGWRRRWRSPLPATTAHAPKLRARTCALALDQVITEGARRPVRSPIPAS